MSKREHPVKTRSGAGYASYDIIYPHNAETLEALAPYSKKRD